MTPYRIADPPPVEIPARDDSRDVWEIAVGVVTLPFRIVGAVVELLALLMRRFFVTRG